MEIRYGLTRYIEIVRKILELFPEDLLKNFKKSHKDESWDDKYDYEAILDLKSEVLELATYNLNPYDDEKNSPEIEMARKELKKIFTNFTKQFNKAKYDMI
jgi:hypothetical protein